jgi:hypothetical protein
MGHVSRKRLEELKTEIVLNFDLSQLLKVEKIIGDIRPSKIESAKLEEIEGW